MSHDHDRAGLADQRAVIALARAVAARDPEAAALATLAGPCGVCVAICAMQLGYALATSVAGETFVTEPLLRRLLSLLDTAEREIDAAPN